MFQKNPFWENLFFYGLERWQKLKSQKNFWEIRFLNPFVQMDWGYQNISRFSLLSACDS